MLSDAFSLGVNHVIVNIPFNHILGSGIDYEYDGKIYHLSSPSIEISSNDIRKRCSNGSSIHFFLPEDVIDYIERNDLYGSTADRRKA